MVDQDFQLLVLLDDATTPIDDRLVKICVGGGHLCGFCYAQRAHISARRAENMTKGLIGSYFYKLLTAQILTTTVI
jgi:hypothetical protein